MTKARTARRGGRACRTLCTVVTVATLIAGAGEARATVATYRSTRDLAGGATAIFRGLVLERAAHWQGDLIVTDVLVAVDECWAGECQAPTAVVREIGGEVDGIGMLSPEPTPLPIGEEVVVFGRQNGPVLVAVGGAQGVFRVEASGDRARRDLASVEELPAAVELELTVSALRREVVRAWTRTVVRDPRAVIADRTLPR